MITRRRLVVGYASVVVAATLLGAPADAQTVDGQAAAPSVFLTGPLEWTPTIKLVDFGYDNNLFLDPDDRAVEDISGTLSPAVAAFLTTSRYELRSAAAVDFVYFERYAEERTINQRYSGRAAVTVSLFQPFVAGEWDRVRDRQSPEVDLRARRLNRTLTAGVGLFSLSRTSLTLSMSRNELVYDAGQIFQSVDLATQLNRSTQLATLGVNVAVTPLTTFTASAVLQQDRYPAAGKDQEIRRASVGVQFNPDALITGHAMVGYSQLTVEDAAAIPYRGLTTDIDVGYTLFEVTRLQLRYGRETAASIQEPYYLQSTYGLQVLQAFLGPVELLLRGTRQTLDYPGIPVRNLPGHLDVVRSYAFGVLVRLSSTSTLDTTYEVSDRRSSNPSLRFERRRLLTSVSLGF